MTSPGPALGALAGRVAAAPISWGICEVPGWGEMLPAERVLAEMQALGLPATEFGAPGFLPAEPEPLRELLNRFDLALVGGFVPLVLQNLDQRAAMLERAREVADLFAACGATRFVTALVQDDGWSRPTPLDADGMKVVGEGLAEIDEIARSRGLLQVLHPHVDTLVETAHDVELALEHTDVAWCLDTGHLVAGGVDPVAFAKNNAGRVGHVHLKDVATGIASRVLDRDLTLVDGVKEGLFTVLGEGDVAVDEVVLTLEEQDYDGCYVLEQDTALATLPDEGSGPVRDVAACLDYLRTTVVPRLPQHSTR
ncbi:MAG: TIM barrel protein [Intrasporangiaceae bacterium]|nr:TIM barrel protein [Intrasporangiaceae bacterium]